MNCSDHCIVLNTIIEAAADCPQINNLVVLYSVLSNSNFNLNSPYFRRGHLYFCSPSQLHQWLLCLVLGPEPRQTALGLPHLSILAVPFMVHFLDPRCGSLRRLGQVRRALLVQPGLLDLPGRRAKPDIHDCVRPGPVLHRRSRPVLRREPLQ